jgi:hypothetical protein
MREVISLLPSIPPKVGVVTGVAIAERDTLSPLKSIVPAPEVLMMLF